MRINTLIAGLGAVTLLNTLSLYAADCSTSFDQSCLSQGYSQATAEKSQQQSNKRLDHLNKEACKEAVAERRRTQLIQNQLDTELALNDLLAQPQSNFDLPAHLTHGMSFLPPSLQAKLTDSARRAAYQGEEARIRQRGLWNQKMIEAKSAEDMASCLAEE